MYYDIGTKEDPHLIEVPKLLAAHILKQHGHDQQKRVLDRLVDKQYNKIHEDALSKLMNRTIDNVDAVLKYKRRAKEVIWSLWQERTRFKSIMKTQDFEYAKLLKENQELRAEMEKIRNTKGEYGLA